MRELVVDNYVINDDISKIINLLSASLTNGKLKDIQDKGTDIVVSCPFHAGGQEEHGSCFIRKSDGVFHCFGCGEKGTFLKFVAKCFDSSLDYAKNWLIKTFNSQVIEKQVFIGEDIKLTRKVRTKCLDESILDQYKTWSPYLKARGITQETASRFKLRYDQKYRQILFPYYDEHNRFIAILKRSIDTKTFFIPPDIAKPIYGINEIALNNIHTCVLTEGLFDCLLGNQYGMPTIATLGQPSEDQIAKLNKLSLTTVYLMFDNDAAGRRFSWFVRKKLDKRIIIHDVKITGKKDIGELTKDEFWNFINKARED